jgi:hypothetical protein
MMAVEIDKDSKVVDKYSKVVVGREQWINIIKYK